MHWVKWVVEVWIVSGVILVILGLLWTSKLTSKSQANLVKSAPPQTELSSDQLSEVRSA